MKLRSLWILEMYLRRPFNTTIQVWCLLILERSDGPFSHFSLVTAVTTAPQKRTPFKERTAHGSIDDHWVYDHVALFRSYTSYLPVIQNGERSRVASTAHAICGYSRAK